MAPFPEFLPDPVRSLSEAPSIALCEQMQQVPVTMPWGTVLTNTVRSGEGGPPLVLLHGFDSSLLEYRRLVPLLAQRHTTWALDLWGFGFTARSPQQRYSPAQIKLHLAHFWQQYVRQPMILVGASMGGAVALDFVLTYPEAVAQLVLIDSAGLTSQPLSGKVMFPPLDRLATKFLGDPRVRRKITATAYHDPQFVTEDACLCGSLHVSCDHWSEALIAFTKSGGYGSFRDRLGEITTPTTLIWGKQDRILGTKGAGQFQKGIPHSQLHWIDACGHVPHAEQPEATAAAIYEAQAAHLV